jgi:hypothetical protein
VVSSVVKGNVSQGRGGGIYNEKGSYSYTTSTITENIATEQGGGVYNSGGLFTLANSRMILNKAEEGGAIYNQNNEGVGQVNAKFTPIEGNRAVKKGGGIFLDEGTVALTNSNIEKNSAPKEGGGGIFIEPSGNLVRVTSLIILNKEENCQPESCT